MRQDMSVMERFRIRKGPAASESEARVGTFVIPTQWGTALICHLHAPPGAPWERLAVIARKKRGGERTPSWEEMQLAKSAFFRDDETVVQYHVPEDEKLHLPQPVLFLWRSTKEDAPRPSRTEASGRRIIVPR